MVFYNEIDQFAASWLRELIKEGVIANGIVDERSIAELTAKDLEGYTQCHFFAGIGVWSYALRSAGWSDDTPVWTGSCPCQPFSASGKRGGFDDKRHLWPEWYRLIRECRPDVLFGEQVASNDGLTWLDLVSSDLENSDYTFGAVDTCSAGFGAPHIRQRLYFVADSNNQLARGRLLSGEGQRAVSQSGEKQRTPGRSTTVKLADAERGSAERRRFDVGESSQGLEGEARQRERLRSGARAGRDTGLVAHSDGRLESDGDLQRSRQHRFEQEDGRADIVGNTLGSGLEGHAGHEDGIGEPGRDGALESGPTSETGATNGFWKNAEWIYCRDNRWRPIEPGSSALVDRAPNRLGQLRGYGNAINSQQAKAFIEAYMQVRTAP